MFNWYSDLPPLWKYGVAIGILGVSALAHANGVILTWVMESASHFW